MTPISKLAQRCRIVSLGAAIGIVLVGCSESVKPFTSIPTVATKSNASTVDLSWPAVEGAVSYSVFRCAVPSGVVDNLCSNPPADSCTKPIATIKTTSFSDTPSGAEAYCYRVKACADSTANNCGEYSTAVAAAVRPDTTTIAVAQIEGAAQVAFSGQNVTLTGSANNSKGTVSYQWQQIGGTKVTLQNAATPTLSFVAPTVSSSSNELLSFKLIVTDDRGVGESGKVAVEVQPANNVVVKTFVKQREVNAGDNVSLHASGVGAATGSYAWRQVSPANPVITLVGGTTANPTFIAPNVNGVTFGFDVTYTDTTTGRNASAKTSVHVRRPPTQVTSQPLTIPTSGSSITPQKLTLQAVPDATVVSGMVNRFAMGATGGKPPYTWSWAQTGGRTVSISGSNSPLLVVTAPSVTTAEVLTFVATVTDAGGSMVTGSAYMKVLPMPTASPGATPPKLVINAPKQVVAGTPVLITTTLTKPVFSQTSGPVATVSTTPSPNGATTTVQVTPPVISTTTAPIAVTITGTNSAGQTVQQVQPILVIRTPNQVAPTVAPPTVPVVVPAVNPPLTVASVGIDRADEGQAGVYIGVQATGGTGTYTYRWTYDKQTGQPDVNLRDTNTSHPNFDAPSVNGKIIFKFTATVTDGGQTASIPVYVAINDLASTLVGGTVNNLTVESGHFATLSAPVPSGGVPPYSFAVRQTSGRSVGTLSGKNPAFPVPTLAAGAPDETLEFEYTVTDGFGNTAAVTEQVVVKAPPKPPTPAVPLQPLAVTISGPDAVAPGTGVSFNTNATGGVPPYAYSYSVTELLPNIGKSYPLSLPSVANPSVGVPNFIAIEGNRSYRIVATVTDSATPPTSAASSPFEIFVGYGKQCLVCGDHDAQMPCSDMDLVLAVMTDCPLSQSYCMTDNFGSEDPSGMSLYKRCVGLDTVKRLWWNSTASNPNCANGYADGSGADCHFACYGDKCNLDGGGPDSPPATKIIFDTDGVPSYVPW